MRTSPLLPLLRSRTQGDVLALLYLHPDREYSLTDIARRTGATVSGVHQEVSRLVDAGFLADRKVGNVRMVRSMEAGPLTQPLTDLLAVTYGPRPVLTDALASVPGVQRAFIYGSWAARHQGEPGPVPADVDVLVVGTVDRDVLDEIAEEATERLGRDVTIRRISPTAWDGDTDAFVKTVKSGALVDLTESERN